MHILSSKQIRQWDEFTIKHEPVSSIDLMERAVTRCVSWLEDHDYLRKEYIIYCGKGNNGGDGLALARMLLERQCQVAVYVLDSGGEGSEDYKANLRRLQHAGKAVTLIQASGQFPSARSGSLIVDALFGTGLNRPADGLSASLISHINSSHNEVIAVDMPSGMFADRSSKGNTIVNATNTLSFHCYKLAFLLPENEQFTGGIHMLDIGLHPGFLETIRPEFELMQSGLAGELFKPRRVFAHKGDFGHALIVAGSYGKMGAAVLSAHAVLRTGAGLLTCYIPACGYEIMQTSVPEAMVITDQNDRLIQSFTFDVLKYDAIGIGPGLGTEDETRDALRQILKACNKPVVLDADGLNIVAYNAEMLKYIPPFSIISPHPREFERLFGKSPDDFERLELARIKATELQLIIILKGHHTAVCIPGGRCSFNTTGNSGMATGGSGDVLTGILTSLLAQGYSAEDAALLGVYLHGLAGDFAANRRSQEAMVASDITEQLGEAFKSIQSSLGSLTAKNVG